MSLERAQTLLGIPFERSGRTTSGADCLGVVCLYFKACDVPFVDPWSANYAAAWTEPKPDIVPARPLGEWVELPVECELEDRDLLVSSDGRHVEVYVGGGRVLRGMAGTCSHLARVDRTETPKAWRYGDR